MVKGDLTEGYYNVNAEEYFRATVGIDMTSIYDRFISKLVPGARILDAGCGSGRDTLAFVKRGYSVSAALSKWLGVQAPTLVSNVG